ncbi:hypothetical protein CSUI_008706 [Cystoisospora suis]|uniref:Transmembrane protein n=1 Tax=Cystoisospora suis TaxID=483139 RepID=A0A2C6KLU8_9APIC|nr:hypothetical protein CSUI_008706 [Cystoisospora suis]
MLFPFFPFFSTCDRALVSSSSLHFSSSSFRSFLLSKRGDLFASLFSFISLSLSLLSSCLCFSVYLLLPCLSPQSYRTFLTPSLPSSFLVFSSSSLTFSLVRTSFLFICRFILSHACIHFRKVDARGSEEEERERERKERKKERSTEERRENEQGMGFLSSQGLSFYSSFLSLFFLLRMNFLFA